MEFVSAHTPKKEPSLRRKPDESTRSAVCIHGLNVESMCDKEKKIQNISQVAHTGGKAARERLVRRKYLNLTLFCFS